MEIRNQLDGFAGGFSFTDDFQLSNDRVTSDRACDERIVVQAGNVFFDLDNRVKNVAEVELYRILWQRRLKPLTPVGRSVGKTVCLLCAPICGNPRVPLFVRLSGFNNLFRISKNVGFDSRRLHAHK